MNKMSQYDKLNKLNTSISMLSGKMLGGLEVLESIRDMADANTIFYAEEKVLTMISDLEKFINNEPLITKDQLSVTRLVIDGVRKSLLK
jgi:hypothetical protein